MTTYCNDPVSCINGNCVGCMNGVTWCQDPRCAPNCPDNICHIQSDTDTNGNYVVILILISLITILFIVWFVYGPQLLESHNDHVRAGVIVPEYVLYAQ